MEESGKKYRLTITFNTTYMLIKKSYLPHEVSVDTMTDNFIRQHV